MKMIDIPSDRFVQALLGQNGRGICLLDSCGVGRSGSNRLIAGVDPVDVRQLCSDDPSDTLRAFVELLSQPGLSALFTISYDFGPKLQGIPARARAEAEPDIFVALFDSLLIHDYSAGTTVVAGTSENAGRYEEIIEGERAESQSSAIKTAGRMPTSNFTREQYLTEVEGIKELIRDGETYQVNLTQQLSVPLGDNKSPADVFLDLRRQHPAPFAAYIDRGPSVVVSASPEQFLTIENSPAGRTIKASPIKGTRPRGTDQASDDRIRAELLTSEKDRAENTMIVDLMRNDLGRVCEFGSVKVDELCRLDPHPTLFHLVSEVSGTLRNEVNYSDVIKAVFPCGSITGAPKLRTLEIIDRIETVPRGLSMGAIGCRIAPGHLVDNEIFEMSVAIRTMVVRNRIARFNVGGGITIDSDPAAEYDESMLKAKALLNSLSVGLANTA